MTVTVGFQVVPLVEEARVYPVVDAVIAHIASKGVRHEVGAMETVMEGELSILLDIVKECQEICIDHGAKRVVSTVRIDYKPGGVTIDEKVAKYR